MVIINPTAVVGNNCTIMQFTMIGSEKWRSNIGVNLYIGPRVSIIENITIASYVIVGTRSVVTKDFPQKATVAGNYTKILHFNRPGSLLKRICEDD